MILLLFINQSALSSSARIRLQEGRDLVHHRTLDEIERADKARFSYLFGMIEADTNLDEVDSPLPQLGFHDRFPIEVTESIISPVIQDFAPSSSARIVI